MFRSRTGCVEEDIVSHISENLTSTTNRYKGLKFINEAPFVQDLLCETRGGVKIDIYFITK